MVATPHVHIYYPLSLTRTDIFFAEFKRLGTPLDPESKDEIEPPTVHPEHAMQTYAIARYRSAAPLGRYNDDDLVFLPHRSVKYMTAKEFRSVCAENGLIEAQALRVMQNYSGEPGKFRCVGCGSHETIVVPGNAKNVVVIKNGDGGIVQVVDVSGARRSTDAFIAASVAEVQRVSIQLPDVLIVLIWVSVLACRCLWLNHQRPTRSSHAQRDRHAAPKHRRSLQAH